MAGYRTVDELMDILEEECLEFDAVVSIVGGNNKYDYQVITVPKKNVHIKKDGAYIDMLGLDWSYVKKKYKLNTTNFLFLCNC